MAQLWLKSGPAACVCGLGRSYALVHWVWIGKIICCRKIFEAKMEARSGAGKTNSLFFHISSFSTSHSAVQFPASTEISRIIHFVLKDESFVQKDRVR